ncbi:hypothetical protein VNO78_16332 [Psophocarpus tetragonolobus]|uniref:Uncharacterized protein n=1 Tax=Psophocarpus tetragonolobus TaxID=3891 RepID=A0AAN9SFL1_PSOTE
MMEEVDTESFYLSNEELDILRQNELLALPMPQPQNDPFGVPMIQHESMHDNNTFPTVRVVSNVDVEGPLGRDKEPMIAQDQFIHGNSNKFCNGVGNFDQQGSFIAQGNQTNGNIGPQNDQRVVMELNGWPPPPQPFNCSCCQVLREIIHMNNGHRFDKLEIHGSVGMISHAIIHIKDNTPGSSSESHRMIDFCGENIDDVRNFIKRYCEDHERLGFINLDDPFSDYYDAICTGLYWGESIDEDDDLGPQNGDDNVLDPEPGPSNGKNSTTKRNMKVQLESLVNKVKILKDSLDFPKPGEEEARPRIQAEILRLQQEMIDACAGIAPTKIQMYQFDE